jgi:hypothetical protein
MRMRLAFVLLACCGGSAGEPPSAPTAPSATSSPEVAAPPAAPAPAAKEPVETGKDCAKAVADCGGGVCTVTLKNGCAQAITCDLAVGSTCKARENMLEAAGRKRDTFAAQSEGELVVGAKCTEGDVLSTSVKSLSCK